MVIFMINLSDRWSARQMIRDVYSNTITIGQRDLDAPNHWRMMKNNLDMRHGPKKIFCFGGNGTLSSELANGMCKVAEKYLGDDADKYEIYGAYYENEDKTPPSVAARSLFIIDEILVPLIADKDKFGNLHRLPTEEACRNMREKVMFVNHCHGSRISHEISKEFFNSLSKFDEIMLNIGYSREESLKIHRQLVVIDHNNPCADVGTLPVHSTTLYRITHADEHNKPVKYNVDSFGYFLATEEMNYNDIYAMDISSNELALVIPSISAHKKSEHNGAYWQIPLNDKFMSAAIEETIFMAFFKELANSKYIIGNWQQIEQNVMRKNSNLQKIYEEMSKDGAEFMENYGAYQQNVHKEFNEAKEKVLNGQFSAQDGVKISQEALFFHDENGKNILDLAVKRNDAVTAGIIWHNMLNEMPLFEHGKDIKTIYQNCSHDMLETKEKHRFYVMQALENNNVEMFESLVQNRDVLVGLDYSHAGADTALCAAEKFCSFNWHDKKMSLPAMQLIYGNSVKMLAKRCLKNDIPPEKSESLVAKLLQKHKLYIKRESEDLTSLLDLFPINDSR